MISDKRQLPFRILNTKSLESRISMVNKTLSALLLERMLIEFPKTAMISEKTSRTLKLEMSTSEVISELMIFISKKKKSICSHAERILNLKPTPTKI